jgi:hypothetical protein
MSDEAGGAVETKSGAKKKSGKRKASGEPRAPRTNPIEAEFGVNGLVAAKAYFSTAISPEKAKKIQASIDRMTAKLNAAQNSDAVIAKYKTKLQSIWQTISGETEQATA